jgi:hypothetical protein
LNKFIIEEKVAISSISSSLEVKSYEEFEELNNLEIYFGIDEEPILYTYRLSNKNYINVETPSKK